jgi:para-aminobenzoate synthetase/4-amino-4-deoxychorismate lyase
VTGAPKIRAAQIIRELEAEPRGAYTGSIGYLSPASRPGSGRLSGIEARFSVAIRTVTIDRAAGLARAGVGGGITWESEADAEYEECMAKARYLTEDRPAFELLETLLFEPGRGYYLLGRHLHRLAASARYFGFAFDEGRVRASLEAVAAGASRVLRVRLCLDRDGTPSLASTQLQAGSDEVTAVVAKGVIVDDRDRFLYHKTTHRGLYERALAEARVRGADEAILINARGQVTETTAGNLVVQTGSGRLITPPVSCGLLAGTLRDELLAAGRIEEGVVHTADLRSPSIVAYRINSVRRWVRLDIDPGADRVGGDATAAHSDRQL